MSSRKRPGLGDVANAIARSISNEQPEEVREPAPIISTDQSAPVASSRLPANTQAEEETEEAPAWRKFTVPFRTEQLERLERQLARWSAEKHIKISAAEVLRLGLDTMLKRMLEDPDELLALLYEQEQREQAMIPTRKFGRSRGLAQYLKRKRGR